MTDNGHPDESHPADTHAGLDASQNARSLVRLLQCEQCSYPLRDPMTLPCGNSLCRMCVPSSYRREHITYPQDAGRLDAFQCPFDKCDKEHTLGDCSVDVTLKKLMSMVRSEVDKYRIETSNTSLFLEEKLDMQSIRESSMDIMPRSRMLHGGRLVATYILADMGELNYKSGVVYSERESYELLDDVILKSLKRITRSEFDCQICYGLYLEPLTTACGHTFCRRCIARVLDHSDLCPICRRQLAMRPAASLLPENERISHLLVALCPESVEQRAATAIEEDRPFNDGRNTPLFVCLSSYPGMPTFLHIFEPRYRLMMRRAIENDRTFGMIAPNRNGRWQGQLGHTYFKQYGTLLRIESFQMLADGRSLIEAFGVSRFKILETEMLDGYLMGRVERIDDMTIMEEESLEARETASPPPAAMSDPIAQIDYLPTQQLLEISQNFVTQGRASSAAWLHERVLSAYGQPPADPAVFPYWFASVLPISEEEKYQMLPTRSVRDRLKLCARWVRRLEAAAARW